MNYRIELKRSVVKELKKIPRESQIKVAGVIKALSVDPRPPGCTKLVDSDYYRVRCGVYRIIYLIEDEKLVIIILKIGHRKDVYR